MVTFLQLVNLSGVVQSFVILNTYIYSDGTDALEFYDVSSEPL